MAEVICIACGESNPPWFRACQACDAVLLHSGPVPDPPAPKAPPIPEVPATPEEAPDAEPEISPTAAVPPFDERLDPEPTPETELAPDPDPDPESTSEPSPDPVPAPAPAAPLSVRERAHLGLQRKGSAAPVSSGFSFESVAPTPAPETAPSTPPSTPAPAVEARDVALADPFGADTSTLPDTASSASIATAPPLPTPAPPLPDLAAPDAEADLFDWTSVTTTTPDDGWSVPAPVTPIPAGDITTLPDSDWPEVAAAAPHGNGMDAPAFNRHAPAQRPADRPQVSYPEEPSRLRKMLPRLLLAVLVALVVLGLIWYLVFRDTNAGSPATTGPDGAAPTTSAAPLNLTALMTTAEASVAFVDSSGCDADRSGTGFFVQPNLLVTSATLIAGDDEPQVVTIDNATSSASVLAVDVNANLALLRVDEGTFEPLALAASPLVEGDSIVALEDPSDQPGVRANQLVFAGYLAAAGDSTASFVLAAEDAPEGDGAVILNASGLVVGIIGTIDRAGTEVHVGTTPEAIAAFLNDAAEQTTAVDAPCIAAAPADDWSSTRFGSTDLAAGDSATLDHLFDACEAAALAACDDLAIVAPDESEYQLFGLSCGETTEPSVLACTATVDGDQLAPRVEWAYGDCAYLPRGSRQLLRAADCDEPHDAQVIAFDVVEDQADVNEYCTQQLPDDIESMPVWAEPFDVGGLVPTAGTTTPRAICFLYLPGESFDTAVLDAG